MFYIKSGMKKKGFRKKGTVSGMKYECFNKKIYQMPYKQSECISFVQRDTKQ